ncbi:MAG: urease accessory protein UreD [Betaproteobacteria bacterium]|nr:urease accessory protein UreD [Betaproteobacteria bacterium]
MDLSEVRQAAGQSGWDAKLSLAYAHRDGRTVLARREHLGPLRVQRNLYPEGAHTCHSIVLHPPGGIAGGDVLAIDIEVGTDAAALLTTPGAGKWYRSAGLPASQALQFDIGKNASLEWLPQETILFDGADAKLQSRVRLASGSLYLGWEILCFGRQASGERFATGRIRLDNEIWRDDRCLWRERGGLSGGDPLFDSPIGLAGRKISATLVAAGHDVSPQVLAACREVAAGDDAQAGITRFPDVLIARWLGDDSEEAKRYLIALWTLLRPAMRKLPADPPRIWAT